MKKPATPDPQTVSDLEPAAADLQVVAKAALEQIEQSQLGGRMKRALILVAKGSSVRDAATAEDYSSHSDVYRLARKYGLVDLRTKAIVDTHRSVAKLSSEELEQRLLDKSDGITTAQLAVIGGISTDKVLLHEKSKQDDGSAYMSAFEKAAARIVESGAGLELRVHIGPSSRPARDAIDVTPGDA